jgi:glycosyltransferase involved in cell wall biosynthesis
MKVAILIDRKTLGGVEKIAIEQVKALQKIGVDATLVILRRDEKLEENFKDILLGVPQLFLDDRLPAFLRLSFKFPIFHFFSFFHLSYAFLLPFVVKKREFDYIIVHGTFTTFTAISLKAFKGMAFSAFIWDSISYILNRVYKASLPGWLFSVLSQLAKFLDTLIVKTADMILVGGKAHNDFFRQIYPAVKITTIPPSTHQPSKAPSGKKKNQLLLVTAWKKGKKAEYLLELLPKLKGIPVKMVGIWISQEYLQEITNLLKKAKLDKQVEIVGAVTEQDLTKYYQESLVFLQINDDRGFGMPALEAATNGTTFVIPDGQGVCELFINGKEGFFVEETNTTQISTILNDLFAHPDKALSMGKEAAKKSKQYSWEEHAKLLKEIAAQNTKSRRQK